MDEIERETLRFPRVEVCDFDGDGSPEGILENAELALFFSPHDGGTLFEMDYKPKPFNFGNVLTRREEVYHDQLRKGNAIIGQETAGDLSIHELIKAKEADLDKLLVYDPWRRVSFRDRFISTKATADALWSGAEPEWGPFARLIYGMTEKDDTLELEAQGHLSDNSGGGVRIVKRVGIAEKGASFNVEYEVTFESGPAPGGMFGTEIAFNLLTGDADDRYYWSRDAEIPARKLGNRGVLPVVSHIGARDEWQRLDLEYSFSRPARLYYFPVDTVSQSEDGQERVHQGCVVMPCWEIKGAGTDFRVVIHVEIRNLDEEKA